MDKTNQNHKVSNKWQLIFRPFAITWSWWRNKWKAVMISRLLDANGRAARENWCISGKSRSGCDSCRTWPQSKTQRRPKHWKRTWLIRLWKYMALSFVLQPGKCGEHWKGPKSRWTFRWHQHVGHICVANLSICNIKKCQVGPVSLSTKMLPGCGSQLKIGPWRVKPSEWKPTSKIKWTRPWVGETPRIFKVLLSFFAHGAVHGKLGRAKMCPKKHLWTAPQPPSWPIWFHLDKWHLSQ